MLSSALLSSTTASIPKLSSTPQAFAKNTTTMLAVGTVLIALYAVMAVYALVVYGGIVRVLGRCRAGTFFAKRSSYKIQHRLCPDPPGSRHTADPLDAHDQRAEHQRIDHHLQRVHIDAAQQLDHRLC